MSAGQPDFALGELTSAWASGPAAAAAPEIWAEALAPGGVEAELRLIALAGQALEVGWRPVPPGDLKFAAPFPELGLEFLAGPQRLRFRRILKEVSGYSGGLPEFLSFLASRGRVAHPLDWTPGANEEDVPALYAPWRDWAAERAPAPAEALSAANWEDWTKSGRRRAFADLRKADPDAARELLVAKLPTIKADERQDLVETLRIGLGFADNALLEDLKAKDRSAAIKQLAEALMGRLAVIGETSPHKAAVLFYEEFVKIERKGILKRELKLTGKHNRHQANTERASLLVERAGLDALAEVAKASRLELATAWPHGEWSSLAAFRELLLTQGTTEEIKAAFIAICDSHQTGLSAARLGEMLDRLPKAERLALLPKALARNGADFEDHLSGLGAMIGRTPLAVARRAPFWATSLEMIAAERKGEPHKMANLLPGQLRVLGGILDSAGAREALEEFARMGLSPADPRLDLLILNAELPEAAL